MPLLRLLSEARRRLAVAAGCSALELDAELRRCPPDDREAWLEDIAGDDGITRVASWVLFAICEGWGSGLDVTAAPVQGRELLARLCELSAPVAVLLCPGAEASCLARALRTADELVDYMRGHAVAVSSYADAVNEVMADRSQDLQRFRANVVLLQRTPRVAGSSRTQLARILCEALNRDERTKGAFEIGAEVPVYERKRPIPVDLLARDAQLAIEIDDWYRFHDAHGYDAERDKDIRLQQAGYYVIRFMPEDIENRLDVIVDDIAICLDGRRTSELFMESTHD